jgi:hypothetical protein
LSSSDPPDNADSRSKDRQVVSPLPAETFGKAFAATEALP